MTDDHPRVHNESWYDWAKRIINNGQYFSEVLKIRADQLRINELRAQAIELEKTLQPRIDALKAVTTF